VSASPPPDLAERVRRSARVDRVTAYVTALVVAIPLSAIGVGALADDATGVGAAFLGVAMVLLVVTGGALRRRYGPGGSRWSDRLREAAAAPGDWREVDVWFVRPSLVENHRSKRTALIAEPGRPPHLASTLLVEAGAGLSAGRGRVREPVQAGRPLLLEKDGEPLWPCRPARGRLGAWVHRTVAALPLSSATLERPGE
jgi:hypothetical protein